MTITKSNTVGQKLTFLRRERGLKQKEIAALLNIGRPRYSSYEEDRCPAPFSIIEALCEHYGVSVTYFAKHNSKMYNT